MAHVAFPVAGAVITVSVPEGVPIEVAVAAARAAVSAGAAAQARNKLRNAAGMGTRIAERRIAAYQAGAGYAELAANDVAVLAKAARIGRKPGEPDPGMVLDVMLTGATSNADGTVEHDLSAWIDPAVARWTRTILGHRIGGCGVADCRICALAADRQWPMVLAACGVSERLLLDLYAAAAGTGLMPSLTRRIGGRSALDELIADAGLVF